MEGSPLSEFKHGDPSRSAPISSSNCYVELVETVYSFSRLNGDVEVWKLTFTSLAT